MTLPNDIAKRNCAYVFLFSFLFNYFGICTIFEVQQFIIRREVKEQIEAGVPDDKLHKLSFAVDQIPNLEWEEEGREFRFKGQMYDIVRREVVADSVYYFCINDVKETNLVMLDELVRKHMDDDSGPISKTTRKVTKTVKSLKFSASEKLFTYGILVPKSTIDSSFAHFYSSPCIELVGPPPKSV
ncbi:MAG: hypothetical protein ACMVP2_05630 [Imperialibacter sp.]|uniref:hypothetical protein n=1 Tax=Imperialibacter sp. TaxID=2038411 RepID=UPI0030DD28D0|tara:strand:+ start:97 stop:651 length:555 start_codon:yes stop_codon:yes gene_type:complete